MAHQDSMQNGQCRHSHGMLPECAPLANPYVPYQQAGAQTYQAPVGMIRGTLYPGLDLPFMGMVNQTEHNRTPINRLQSLNFAITELGLYLDTHATDLEAVELFNQYVEQYMDALEKLEDQTGPLQQMTAAMNGQYDWVHGPWPWDYDANKEG